MENFITAAAGAVSQALSDADRPRFSTLLRFLSTLVPANVLHPSAAIGQLQRIVETALEITKTGTLDCEAGLPKTGLAHARVPVQRTSTGDMCLILVVLCAVNVLLPMDGKAYTCRALITSRREIHKTLSGFLGNSDMQVLHSCRQSISGQKIEVACSHASS